MQVQYTASVEVKIPQLVHCVHCDHKFIYEMAVTGVGYDATGLFQDEDDARASAREQARENLNHRLSRLKLCEAIPCPKCFRHQPYMRAVAARERFIDVSGLAVPLELVTVALLCVAAICWFQYPDTREAVIPGALGTVAVWAVCRAALALLRWRIDRYDPDTEQLSQREFVAEKRTVSLADFDAAQAKRARREYKKYAEAVRVPKWGGSSFEVPDPLVISWWFDPSVMLNGGTVVIELPDGESATFHVPEDSPPGEVLDLHASSPAVVAFQLRVTAMRVHPDEQRLE